MFHVRNIQKTGIWLNNTDSNTITSEIVEAANVKQALLSLEMLNNALECLMMVFGIIAVYMWLVLVNAKPYRGNTSFRSSSSDSGNG